MKKVSLLSVLILGLLFLGCDNDNDNGDDEMQTEDTLVVSDQSFEITEGVANGDVVGTVEATSSGTLSYSISVQEPMGALEINETSGVLSIADADLVNAQAGQQITLTIDVSTSSVSDTISVDVTVSAEDTVEVSDLSVEITKGVANGDVVGTVEATSSGTLSYAITTQEPMGALEINETSGELSVADADIVNAQVRQTISLTIEVSTGTVSDSLDLVIPVLDTCPDLSVFEGTLLVLGKRLFEGSPTFQEQRNEAVGVVDADVVNEDDCAKLNMTITGFTTPGGCTEEGTVVLEFVPSAEDVDKGTVILSAQEYACQEDIVIGGIVFFEGSSTIEGTGTYDVSTSTIELTFDYVDDPVLEGIGFERTLIGPGGVDPGDTNADNDGFDDDEDNCVNTPNSDQTDRDNDGLGDACDDDIDGDGILNVDDNCPLTSNPGQEDTDNDGFGDVCDPIDDSNCVSTVNTAIWEGTLEFFLEASETDTDETGTGVSGCNTLTITGNAIRNNCDNNAVLVMSFTPDSDGATTGTVTIFRQRYDCEGDGGFSQEVEGTGTYSEDTGVIEFEYDFFRNGEFSFDETRVIRPE